MNKKILYISYDGMTDPLGQSQVLPYLKGLSAYGYRFTILSFEKKDRYAKLGDEITKICAASNITWVPMSFTRNPPIFAKFYDAVRMRMKAYRLHRENKYDMIHCRSYPSSEIGLQLKRKKAAKFLFDMRGFWADEKKDGGAWNQRNWLFRKVYGHYKKKEKQFISEADCIISLTGAGKKEVMKWASYNAAIPFFVIPCCADMSIFSLRKEGERQQGRKLLGLAGNDLVISYLGSVGAWYMLDEMLELFSVIKERYSNAKFLFITHSSPSLILSAVAKKGLKESDIVITEAERREVPLYVKASDINISFIKPVYSKLSSSPTKLAEVLAMGIPVIVNSGVGDVKETVENSGGGIVIDEFTSGAYKNAADRIEQLLKTDGAAVRRIVEPLFGLEHGVELYSKAYSKIFERNEK